MYLHVYVCVYVCVYVYMYVCVDACVCERVSADLDKTRAGDVARTSDASSWERGGTLAGTSDISAPAGSPGGCAKKTPRISLFCALARVF